MIKLSPLLALAAATAIVGCSWLKTEAPKVVAAVPQIEADAELACEAGEVAVSIVAPAYEPIAIRVCSQDLPAVEAVVNRWIAKHSGAVDAGAPPVYAVKSARGKLRARVSGPAALAGEVAAAVAGEPDAGAQDAGR